MELLRRDPKQEELQNSDLPQKNHKKKNIWRISIAFGATLSGSLYYKPTKPNNHNFKFPMYIQGLSSNLIFPLDVTAEGIQSCLNMSISNVDFGDRVVSRDPTSRSTYCKEMVFTNNSKSKTTMFEIKESISLPSLMIEQTSVKKFGSIVHAERPTPIFFVTPIKGILHKSSIYLLFI
jgi:hypothetical protein